MRQRVSFGLHVFSLEIFISAGILMSYQPPSKIVYKQLIKERKHWHKNFVYKNTFKIVNVSIGIKKFYRYRFIIC